MNDTDLELIEKCFHIFERYRHNNAIPLNVKLALLDLSNDCVYLDILIKKHELENI